MFPTTRLRRLRYHPAVRELVRETRLSPANLFCRFSCGREGRARADCVHARPLPVVARSAGRRGQSGGRIGTGRRDPLRHPRQEGRHGQRRHERLGHYRPGRPRGQQAAKDFLVITDVCCCEYTDHGHCGAIGRSTGRIDVENDATLELLAKQAVVHARAGADVIAPSGMIDGMVGAIRQALDAAGFLHVPILSYAAKYASGFYGPFREAAESTPQFGDRRGYQMDPAAAAGQAMREIELDLAEGADMVMVKPALAYLDVIREARERFPGVPLAAYNVSGEYSMVKAAAERGWLDEQRIALECLTAIRRAGASIILTYWAKDAARWLR